MILTADEIEAKCIVQNGSPIGKRSTSYDATVGAIIQNGSILDKDSFELPDRGMVLVVSNEIFRLPDCVTGLATLKTTWTHQGILALNVGVVDPKWSGPLATTLVNFSNKPFRIKKGKAFLRVIFMEHKNTNAQDVAMSMEEYIEKTTNFSMIFPDTFLNFKKLTEDITSRIFGSSQWALSFTKYGLYIAVAGLIIGILATMAPIAYGISSEWMRKNYQIEQMKKELNVVCEKEKSVDPKIECQDF